MLKTAMQGRSDTVSLDVLTIAELQTRSHESSNLRTDRLQQDDAPQSTKRYLILAYKAEFDQILYPLPLCPEHSPSPEFFRSIIKRIQAEKQATVQEATKVSGARDAKAVQSEEDQRLERILARPREPLRDREMPQDPGAEPVCTASQLEAVQRRAEAAEAALQEERSTHKRMLRHKNRELAEAQGAEAGAVHL
ncbi:g8055 [Coccomyxa viridis]|uniref:G8055 protein n=1 Tax=Coccomyxa viridis TaxID=1274662 RepID=A0ABP1G3V3_9CHLO